MPRTLAWAWVVGLAMIPLAIPFVGYAFGGWIAFGLLGYAEAFMGAFAVFALVCEPVLPPRWLLVPGGFALANLVGAFFVFPVAAIARGIWQGFQVCGAIGIVLVVICVVACMTQLAVETIRGADRGGRGGEDASGVSDGDPRPFAMAPETKPATWRDRLVMDPEVSDTEPVVRGTWVTVGHVVAMIVDGDSWSEILRNHPELEEEDIRACLGYAVEQGE